MGEIARPNVIVRSCKLCTAEGMYKLTVKKLKRLISNLYELAISE